MTTPYNGYRVDVISPATGTVTEITNVIEVQISVGRQGPTGQWPTSTCTVRANYPTGYNAPITGLGPDWTIRVWGPARYPNELPTWIGQVRDYAPEWGIPWNSTTNRGEADILTITGEGYLGAVRGDVTKAAATNAKIYDLVNNLGPGQPTNVFTTDAQLLSAFCEVTYPADDYNFNEWAQQLVASIDGRLIDGVCVTDSTGTDVRKTGVAVFVGSQADYLLPTVKFSDTTNNATNRRYDQLEFGTLGDNYYLGAQVTTASAGTYTYPVINRQIQTSTFNATAQLATQLGKSLVNRFGTFASVPRPIRLSAIASVQHTNNLDSLGLTRDSNTIELAMLCRAKIEIVFRGTTYYANIEGVTLTATPDDTRFTYYLTPQEYVDWLILDNSTFGKLNTGRLAFA